jgi:hypothetical protein
MMQCVTYNKSFLFGSKLKTMNFKKKQNPYETFFFCNVVFEV